MRGNKHILALKGPFEALYASYSREYLKSDPLWFPHQYSQALDQELIAFLASAFAYGSVGQIFKVLHCLRDFLGPSPQAFLLEESESQFPRLEGFYYRFHKEKDLQSILWLLREAYRREGSLAALFRKHYKPDAENIAEALDGFVGEILSYPVPERWQGKKFAFFLSSPREGSSCKRLNLFLRWMIRPKDGLDLGLWDFVSPSQLVVPLDTHIHWVASSLGFTRRQSPNWKMAEEITRNLKLLDPQDPIKYDFALSRLGILDLCPPEALGIPCKKCKKRSDCLKSA